MGSDADAAPLLDSLLPVAAPPRAGELLRAQSNICAARSAGICGVAFAFAVGGVLSPLVPPRLTITITFRTRQ